MDFMTSNSVTMLEKSLDFLWAKQTAISDNISNAETPDYKPKVVTFEESFKASLQRAATGTGSSAASVREALQEANYTVREQQEQTRMDDNGVNVTEQSIEMVRNAYQLQHVMRAITGELTALRTAMRTS